MATLPYRVPPRRAPLRAAGWAAVLKETVAEWWQDKAPRLGAALAYYTILSLAPMLLLITPAVALVFGAKRAREQVIQQFDQLLGRAAGDAVGMLVGAGPERLGPVSTALSVLLLLFAASGVFAELQDAMDTIWEVVPKPGNRAALLGLLRQRFLSFAMVLGIGFLLLVSLLLSAALGALEAMALQYRSMPVLVWTVAHGVVSFCVITVLFAMIFKVLPDVEIRWRDVWLGAALTSGLFALGRFVIGQYIGRAALWASYGTGAKSLVALLVWVYYSAQILFLGAEFTKAYTKRAGSGVPPPSEGAVPLTEEARAEQGISKKEVVEAVADVVERKRREQDESGGEGSDAGSS
jgi:membrane protein